MPKRGRNRIPTLVVNLRKAYFRTYSFDKCRAVIDILSAIHDEKTWQDPSIRSCSGSNYPFYMGVKRPYYSSGTLEAQYTEQIDVDTFLKAHTTGKLEYTNKYP